jgi:hypothetical protein
LSLAAAVSLVALACYGERGADAGGASKQLDEPDPSALARHAGGPNAEHDAGATGPLVVPAKAEPVEEAKAVPADLEGAVKKAEAIPECAELERRSACSIEKLSDELARKEVKRALEEAMATWGDFAADDNTRAQAAAACTQAISEGSPLWMSQGC